MNDKKDIYQEEACIQDSVAAAYDSVYENLLAYTARWDHLCNIVDIYVSSANARILEIGCGTATFLHHLSARGRTSLYGCDLSEMVLEVAQKKVPNGMFRQANMLSMPYENEYFDVVVFMGSLHHVPTEDIEIAFEEAKRVLRPNGVLMVADSNSEYDDFIPMLMTKIFRRVLYYKNYFLMKKRFKFDPHDSANYSQAHAHKSRIDYINMALKTDCLQLLREYQNEHFVIQFEGVLMRESAFDNLVYKILSLMDHCFPLRPMAQLVLVFRKQP